MKRLVALVAAGMLAALALAGCSSADTERAAVRACSDWVTDQLAIGAVTQTTIDMVSAALVEFCDPDKDQDFVRLWTSQTFIETMYEVGLGG